jgi:tRNA/tmRNA/rRNA uracil-C5-methylase (TrmA/RlmC/RlmD family)
MESVSLPEGCEPRCRGCAHRKLAAVQSEAQKLSWVQSRLDSWIAQIEPIRALASSNRWAYRDKVCLHAEWVHSNEQRYWRFGLLAPSENRVDLRFPSYEVIDIGNCPVHSLFIRHVLNDLAKALPSDESLPLAFVGITGTLMTLVIKASRSFQLPESLNHISWRKLGLTGVWINYNPSAGHRAYSFKGWQLLWGEEEGKDEKGNFYGPDHFQQLTPSLHAQALAEVQSFLEPLTNDVILDLYTGIGQSIQIWKKLGIPFLGVELSGKAVYFAQKNIGELTASEKILQGRVGDRIPQLQQWILDQNPGRLLMYMNPPRLGLETQVSQWISQSARPAKIAYLSCSAGTLARDLSILTQAGYLLKRIIPYDFFPQTHHVEILALLVRADVDLSFGLSRSPAAWSKSRSYG